MKRLASVLATMMILTYLSVLVMSAGHLYEWYRLTLGSLPRFFAVGLAGSLELAAFLLSLTSNLLPRASRWAGPGAIAALLVVWLGNYLSMMRAAQGIPAWEVFLSSTFVPIGTLVVAKVVGELIHYAQEPLPLEAKTGQKERREEVLEVRPVQAQSPKELVLQSLPGKVGDVAAQTRLPWGEVLSTLKELMREGRVVLDGEVWRRVA